MKPVPKLSVGEEARVLSTFLETIKNIQNLAWND
jgi:hypothetical protein